VVSGDIEAVLLEVSDAREEDVAVSDCKEVLLPVVSGDIELLLLELSVA